MAKKNSISQVEARRLRRENDALRDQLDRQRNAWVSDFPGGTHIATITHPSADDFLPAVVKVSRKLGHAVVCTVDGNRTFFYALPLAEVAAHG